MATYRPPGDPYQGRAREPWGDGQPPGYAQPADPWGGQSPEYDYDHGYGPGDPYAYPDHQQYGEPGYGDREYETAPSTSPVWAGDVPGADDTRPSGGAGVLAGTAGRGRSTGMVVAIVAAVVLLLGGGGLVGYLAYRAAGAPDAGAGSSPGPAGSRSALPSAPTASPTAQVASGDSRFVTKGQCVVNDGTGDKPVMRVVPCGPNTYEVLARFDGTVKQEKCRDVSGYEYHYYYDSELDALDFVLCLKKRR